MAFADQRLNKKNNDISVSVSNSGNSNNNNSSTPSSTLSYVNPTYSRQQQQQAQVQQQQQQQQLRPVLRFPPLPSASLQPVPPRLSTSNTTRPMTTHYSFFADPFLSLFMEHSTSPYGAMAPPSLSFTDLDLPSDWPYHSTFEENEFPSSTTNSQVPFLSSGDLPTPPIPSNFNYTSYLNSSEFYATLPPQTLSRPLPEQSKAQQTSSKADDDRKAKLSKRPDEGIVKRRKKRVITQRLVWTPELQSLFLAALDHLGVHTAMPRDILRYMNVPGLKRVNVSSHLQKYRIKLAKQQGAPSPTSAAKPSSPAPTSTPSTGATNAPTTTTQPTSSQQTRVAPASLGSPLSDTADFSSSEESDCSSGISEASSSASSSPNPDFFFQHLPLMHG